jgi:hypothetical protein
MVNTNLIIDSITSLRTEDDWSHYLKKLRGSIKESQRFTIDLSYSGLMDRNIVGLAKALEKKSYDLRGIDLSGNPITDLSAKAFASMLTKNKVLGKHNVFDAGALNVSSTGIGKSGLLLLFKA